MTSDISFRDIRDDDRDAILSLLEAVYSEYEGCLLELSEVPELMAPATSFEKMNGRFWAAELGGAFVGMVAMAPSHEPDLVELKKLYLSKAIRGRGVGRRLIELVEAETRSRGMKRIHLWTDTRFETAHRVYERCGYVRHPETRDLHDVSRTVEYHYSKSLLPSLLEEAERR
jgi:putative acetyltransferase